MYNVSLFKFKEFNDQYGHLTPIEGGSDIPFDIKRVYYISRVANGIARGHHAHKKLHQVLICVNGRVKVKVKTPKDEETVELSNPSEGLYIGPMIWREIFDFSEDAVLLVLASDFFSEDEYIRNYDFYAEQASRFF